MQVLALRMKVNQPSPIVSLSVAGKRNPEECFSSIIFRDNQGRCLTLTCFVSLLIAHLSKKTYEGVHLSPKSLSWLMSEMQNTPSRIESWSRLPQNVSNSGRHGCNVAESQTVTVLWKIIRTYPLSS